MKLLWLGLGILGGMALAQRKDQVRDAITRLRGTRAHHERWATRRGQMASTAYGAGSASLDQPDFPLASTAYSAGTASLPMDQQAIRDPKTVR